MTYIDEHLDERLSPNELASKAGLSGMTSITRQRSAQAAANCSREREAA